MERTLIGELGKKAGEKVRVCGWVDVRRDHGKLVFLVMRDRSGTVQAVVHASAAEPFAALTSVKNEWVLQIEGTVQERPEKMRTEGINGHVELSIEHVTVLAAADTLPFEHDADINIDTNLDYRPFTLRRERERAIFKVQSEIVHAYSTFLREQGFTEFQAPKLVGGDAEGGAEVFKLDYFKDKTAYLASSPQFYKQIMVGVFERVFTFATAFRAEKSATTRHLSEYTSLDIEMGFIQDHLDIMRVETALMRFITEHLRTTCADALKTLSVELPLLGSGDLFPHMKLREAQQLIKEKTGSDKTSEPDLEPEDERWLSEYAHDHLGSDFIFITHYPVSKRPFYTYEDERDPGFTKSFDLLFRGVEITTGGQRVHDPVALVERITAKGLDPKNFSFYLQAFAYGMPPHGGWGMGLERLTQKFTGVANVKEATLFPRDMNRIDTLLSETPGNS